MRLGDAERGYLARVVERLARSLGPELVGVQLVGSAALHDDTPGTSDLDVLVVAASMPARARDDLVGCGGQTSTARANAATQRRCHGVSTARGS